MHVRTAMNRERVRERIAHGGEECRREKVRLALLLTSVGYPPSG